MPGPFRGGKDGGHVRGRPRAEVGHRANAADAIDTLGVPKCPGVADQSPVALHQEPGAVVQSKLCLELAVKFVADRGRRGASTGGPDVDSRHAEPGGEILLDVKLVVQSPVPVVDSEPERENPDPARSGSTLAVGSIR